MNLLRLSEVKRAITFIAIGAACAPLPIFAAAAKASSNDSEMKSPVATTENQAIPKNPELGKESFFYGLPPIDPSLQGAILSQQYYQKQAKGVKHNFAYTDTSLYHLVQQNSPDIRSSKALLAESKARFNESTADFQPQIAAGLSGTYEAIGSSAEPKSPVTPTPSSLVNASQFSVYGSVVQPIFLGGSSIINLNIARDQTTMQQLVLSQTSESKIANLYATLHNLYYLDRIRRIAAVNQVASDQLYKLSKANYDNGFMIYADYLNARDDADYANVTKLSVEKDFRDQLNALRHLTQIPNLLWSEVQFVPREKLVAGKYKKDKMYENLVLGDNSEVQQARTSMHIAQKSLNLARVSQFFVPDITANASVFYNPQDTIVYNPSLYDSSSHWSVQVGVNLSLGLWDGGRSIYEVSAQKEALKSAKATFDSVVDSTMESLTSTLLSLQLNQDKIHYYTNLAQSDNESYLVEFNKLNVGSSDLTLVLQQEVKFLTDLISYLEEKESFFSNYYNLQFLTGELKQGPDASTSPLWSGTAVVPPATPKPAK